MGNGKEYYFSSKRKEDNLMVFYRTLKDKSKILTFEISNFGKDGCRVYMEFVDISNVEYPVCLKAWEFRLHSDLEEIKLRSIDDAAGRLRTEAFYENLEHPFNIKEFEKSG